MGNNDPEVPVDTDVVVIDSLRVSLSLFRWIELEVLTELRTSSLRPERAAGMGGRGGRIGGGTFEAESSGLNELPFKDDKAKSFTSIELALH